MRTALSRAAGCSSAVAAADEPDHTSAGMDAPCIIVEDGASNVRTSAPDEVTADGRGTGARGRAAEPKPLPPLLRYDEVFGRRS